jgi:hypothetical protein
VDELLIMRGESHCLPGHGEPFTTYPQETAKGQDRIGDTASFEVGPKAFNFSEFFTLGIYNITPE